MKNLQSPPPTQIHTYTHTKKNILVVRQLYQWIIALEEQMVRFSERSQVLFCPAKSPANPGCPVKLDPVTWLLLSGFPTDASFLWFGKWNNRKEWKSLIHGFREEYIVAIFVSEEESISIYGFSYVSSRYLEISSFRFQCLISLIN